MKSKQDREKLLNAGWVLIRPEQTTLRIKRMVKGQDWHTLEKDFKSKAALNRRMQELLKDPFTIED